MVAGCFLGKIEVEYDAYVQITEKTKKVSKQKNDGQDPQDLILHGILQGFLVVPAPTVKTHTHLTLNIHNVF